MSNGIPTPHGTGDTSKAMFREVILNDILAIKVEAGKPLRQVQVPGETYKSAKRFILNAPNTSDDDRKVRFKILYALPSGKSIYDILAADACGTSLDKADAKIAEWRDAIKALLRYALNLLLAPKRPEFQRLKLSSSYYVYQVSKKLKGAEEILQGMGYERVGGSDDVQELKYNGEVSSGRVAETAADLVILDAELERVKVLAQYAQSEHIGIVLSHILQVRSHPSELYNRAKFALEHYAQHGTLPVAQHHTVAPSHPRNTQPSGGQNQHYPPTQGLPPPLNGQQHSGASNTQPCGGQNQHYPPAQGGPPPLQQSGANTQPSGGQNQQHPPIQGGPPPPNGQQYSGVSNTLASGSQRQHGLQGGVLPSQHNPHTRSIHTPSAQSALPHRPENLQYAGQSSASYGGYRDSHYRPHQQEQGFASQGGQPAHPFEHNSPTRARMPQQNIPPMSAQGGQYAPRGGQQFDLYNNPANAQIPPRNIPRIPAHDQHYAGLPPTQHHHGNQPVAPTHLAQNTWRPAGQQWDHPSAQGQQPHNTDPAQHQHYLAVNDSHNAQQPRSGGLAEQRTPASDIRRCSAPAVYHQHTTRGGQGRENKALYANLPLLSQQPDKALYANVKRSNQQEGIMEQNNQQPEQVGYMNVKHSQKKNSDYCEVTIGKEPRQPATPPNPFSLPEPFVQSLSELDRMNLMTPNSDYGPSSIVNARSDEAGYSGPMDSLSSIRSPEDRSLFNRQAYDAWKVGTPTQEQPEATQRENKDSVTATNKEVPAPKELSKRVENDLRSSEGHSVPPAGERGAAANANVDGNEYVNEEWLQKYADTSDPDYHNQSDQQSKDLKKYDKPVPDSKEKLYASARQFSFQSRTAAAEDGGGGKEQPNEPAPQLSTQSSHPPPHPSHPPPNPSDPPPNPSDPPPNPSHSPPHSSHPPPYSSHLPPHSIDRSRNKSRESATDTPPTGNLGGMPLNSQGASDRYSELSALANMKLFNPGKSRTNPVVSKQQALPEPTERPRTSPHSSLGSDYGQPSEHRPLGTQDIDTLVEDSIGSTGSYSVVDIVNNIPTETGRVSLPNSKASTHARTDPLLNPSHPSLPAEPRERLNVMATSEGKNKRRRQKSVDSGLSDHVTSTATGGRGRQGQDPATRKHLDELQRGRSNSHTDLDRDHSKRDQYRNAPQSKTPFSQPSKPPQTQSTHKDVVISGSWTCSYCTNIVFDGNDICDVCGHESHDREQTATWV